jgi:hypothetical protein
VSSLGALVVDRLLGRGCQDSHFEAVVDLVVVGGLQPLADTRLHGVVSCFRVSVAGICGFAS